MPSQRPILIYVTHFPQVSETFIVNKFIGLLSKGINIHILSQKINKSNYQYFPQLNSKEVQSRIHQCWTSNKGWAVPFLFPIAFIQCFIYSPLPTIKFFKSGFKKKPLSILKSFYLHAKFILLNPKLLHIEFGSLANERMHLKKTLDIKILVSFRGYDINYVGLTKKNYYKETWEHADAIHFLGKDLLKRALQRGYKEKQPYQLIPPAINVDFFSPNKMNSMNFKSRPIHLLSIGRLEWKKGYEFLIESASILKKNNIPFILKIIGDGSYYEAITFAIKQFDLKKQVTLLGTCSSDEIKKQLEWADLFIHSAVSEGFCNAVIEAQSMQLPIICTDSDGLKENVIDGKTGIIVPRRNPRKMASAILSLYKNPPLIKEMGTNGRNHVIKNFKLEKQIKKFVHLYECITP